MEVRLLMSHSYQPTGSTQQPQQQAKDVAGRAAEQAREKTGEMMEKAQDTAVKTADRQMGRAAESVGSLAKALRDTGRTLNESDQRQFGKFAEQAANRLERFSSEIENKSVTELMNDAEDFARREPALFLGGALALGLLAARFLKSSSSRYEQEYSRQYGSRYGQYGYEPSGRSRMYTGATGSRYDEDVRRRNYPETYTHSYGDADDTTYQSSPSSSAPFPGSTPGTSTGYPASGSTTSTTGSTTSTSSSTTSLTDYGNPSTGSTNPSGNRPGTNKPGASNMPRQEDDE
jgi:hypothetical protein